MMKLSQLKFSEEKQRELLERVEIIKVKRKQEFIQKYGMGRISVLQGSPIKGGEVRETQKFFNEKRMKAVNEAKRRKEMLDLQKLKIKIISANRKEYKAGLLKKLEIVKTKNSNRTRGATEFLKQMFVMYILRDLKYQYSILKTDWLDQCKQHLMAFRIQRYFSAMLRKRAKTVQNRQKRILQDCLKLATNTYTNAGIVKRNMDFVKDFLENTNNREIINNRFITWYRKIILVQNFGRTVVQKKQKR